MTTASGVIFTTFHRLGAGAYREVVSRKCYCTPGIKPERIASIDHQEIRFGLMPDGTTFFGETLKGFLKAWNTEYHHPIATKREVALWGSFLGGSKYFWNATKMSIRRDLEDPLIYEAELIGDTNRISTLLQGSFRFFDPLDTTKEERELTDYGFKIKDKVSVFAKNRFFFFPVENMIPPPNITCDMREPFDDCIKKNGETFGVYSINPEAVKLFSLAPSVHTMKQMVNTAFPTIQHFTAEVNEPAKAWSRKPKD